MLTKATQTVDPAVIAISAELPAPGLGDNRSHEKRLRDYLEDKTGRKILIPLPISRKISTLLPESGYKIQTVLTAYKESWAVAEVVPLTDTLPVFSIAIDLGSTSIVIYLVDPLSGETLRTLSMENPQRGYGEDILDRILFACRKDGLETLRKKSLNLINSGISEVCRASAISEADIYYISIAGNTTMCHFLLGLDPSGICKEPYIPAANSFDLMYASEVEINGHPRARLYCFPNTGSYFGGDLLAGIYSTGIHQSEEISMLVDVGTNAEVLLGNRDWMVACAGAAGPALEGGILACGMTAAPGAIERVEFDKNSGKIHFKTINDLPPRGLCGSGIIDLLAAIFRAGIVDQTGKLDSEAKSVVNINGEAAYIIANETITHESKPVYITQSDIKNLIRSKGAMYTILNVVIESVGITFNDIENFYVAGAFGNYISPEKAVLIGMLPDIPLNRFKGLGNAAGKGAIRSLLDRSTPNEIDSICEKITYLEMNTRGDFMNKLTASLFLPHTDISKFPSVSAEFSS